MRTTSVSLCCCGTLLAASNLGCSSPDEAAAIGDPSTGAPTYELTPEPYTTLQAVWEPLVPSANTKLRIDSEDLLVFDVADFADSGLGVRLADGADWIEKRELAPDFTEGKPQDRRSLAYLWQAADPQVIDEESPIRLDSMPFLYRPQGHLATQSFEAHVRSARRISDLSGRPFDFAAVAGDLTDGSHQIEFSWVFTIMNGGVVNPDTGIDDDPVPGPGNDYNDPFVSIGINSDWYAAIGNHDSLYNGGFGRVTEALRAASIGAKVGGGDFKNAFVDGSTPDARVSYAAETVADPERLLLGLTEVLQMLLDAGGTPAGHGLTQEGVDTGVGYFSVLPIDGKPIRLITLNTVNSEAAMGVGAFGHMDEDQFAWLGSELSAADARHELIIVMSHHRAEDFAQGSPVSGEDLVSLLAATDGVVLNIVGHGHRNAKRVIPEAPQKGDYGYWELMLASTVDFPMHSRIVEVVDEGNGYVSIYATNLGQNSPTDSLGHQARDLGAAKLAFGSLGRPEDVASTWEEDLSSQNLLMRIAISPELQASLGSHDWPTRIESEETLKSLSAP